MLELHTISNRAIWDEFSEQHLPKGIKKALYLMPN